MASRLSEIFIRPIKKRIIAKIKFNTAAKPLNQIIKSVLKLLFLIHRLPSEDFIFFRDHMDSMDFVGMMASVEPIVSMDVMDVKDSIDYTDSRDSMDLAVSVDSTDFDRV